MIYLRYWIVIRKWLLMMSSGLRIEINLLQRGLQQLMETLLVQQQRTLKSLKNAIEYAEDNELLNTQEFIDFVEILVNLINHINKEL